MSKKQRLIDIENLITKYEISTQEELTAKLNELGYIVSQATLSRDINDLNLIKVEGVSKKFKYAKSESATSKISPQFINLFKQVVLSMDYANNLIVIKTLAGNANAAGMAIDEMHIPEILGTVAGDDTLLVIAKTNADAEMIIKSLKVL